MAKLRVWNGTSWVYKPLKLRSNVGTWLNKPLRVFDGWSWYPPSITAFEEMGTFHGGQQYVDVTLAWPNPSLYDCEVWESDGHIHTDAPSGGASLGSVGGVTEYWLEHVQGSGGRSYWVRYTSPLSAWHGPVYSPFTGL